MLLTVLITTILLLLSTAQAGPVVKRGSGKAGIAWPGHLPAQLSAAFARPGHTLSWYWNWAPTRPAGSAPPPGQFVATLFRGTTDTSGIPGDSPIVGFNEPDLCVAGLSSCMSMDAVMDAWMAKAVPLLRQGRRVGSPAAAGNTVEYLSDFFAACNARPGCINPSFITMHAYVSTADALKNYVTSVHNAFNMPIWLTEFACHSFGGQPQPTSEQQVHDFMGATTKWLDNQPWVERYSWFGAGQAGDMGGVNSYCRLQKDDGSLTAVGWQYVFKRHT